MSTQQEIIKSFVAYLDNTSLSGETAANEAIKACSKFKSLEDLIENFLADRNKSATGDDFLRKYCGIILDNSDTGAITGYDAEGSKIKTAESVVFENAPSISVYPPSNSFSYKGLTVNVPDASELNDVQKIIVAGIYTWWLKAGLDLAYETYGISFEDNDTTFNSVDITFDMEGYSGSFYESNYWIGESASTDFTIHIDSDEYSDLTNSDLNGTSDSPYLDRTLARLFTRAVLCSQIGYVWKIPSIVGKGLYSLSDGRDDTLEDEIKELVDDPQNLVQILSNDGDDSDRRYTDAQDTAVGYMLFRYLARQSADVSTKINGTEGNDKLENYFFDMAISGGAGNDTIGNYGGKNVTIYGNAGADSINNSGASVKVYGGEGNDTIRNSGANTYIDGGDDSDKIFITSAATKNTVKGGTGNDTIYSSVTSGVRYNYAKGDGNDVIKGWTAKDTLTITGGAFKTSTTGNDVIVSIAGGEKITLVGAKGKTSNIKGTSSGSTVSSSGKNLNNTKASTLVTGTAYNDTIKNSAAQVTIQGNSGADRISITSAAKNNVIVGGLGNDSIYSSVTSGVLYKYAKGDGNDYISGWSANDTLTITGGAYKTSTTGSNVVVSVTGGEKITLVGAKGKKININPASSVSSSGKNISNTKASTLVSGTAYNDTIKNTAAKVTIQGNAGADRISLTSAAKNNVIVGGAGNDSIYSSVTSGVLFKYAKGDGNDYISGWSANDTLTITGGAYKTSTTGSNVVVSVTGGEKITLVGAKGKKININPSNGKNISNTKASTLVAGTAYNDTIKNSASKVTIQGNAGADKISLTSAAKNNVIIGGKGNDSIYSSVTSGVLYKYAKGDGNDYIKGWTAKDTLTITGGAYKTSTTGSNVIVSVTGGEKITLAGAKGKTVNINPKSSTSKLISSDVSSLILFDDDNFVTDTAQIDSIKEITATNYSVGKVTSLQAYDIFAQDSLPIATSYDNK